MSNFTLVSVLGTCHQAQPQLVQCTRGQAESLVIEEWGWGVRGELAQAKKVVSTPLRRVGLRAWCIPCETSSGLGKSQSQLIGTHALAVSHKMGFPI